MPRWKPLPEELDPQVGEFTGQLRRLVDRSGLSVAALADRTGYSRTSWERYLHGRLLPPQGAVVALAEATGAHPGHLTTLWELAERAWSRAEMRQDVTMEAIRVAQARAALGEFEVRPAEAKPSAKAEKSAKAARAAKDERPERAGRPEKAAKSQKAASAEKPSEPSKGVQVAESPQTARMPQLPPMARLTQMPSVPQQRSGDMPSTTDFPEWAAAAPAPAPPPAPASKGEERSAGRRRVAMFAVGAVGALLMGLAAVLLLKPATVSAKKAAPAKPSAAPSAQPVLPAGVRCSGPSCAGKDPEAMGCGGQKATSPSRGMAGGAVIEVRYSAVCHAAWARISGAAAGDQAIISAGGQSLTARVERHGDAYTAMVEVPGDPAKVSACGATMRGAKGCARPTSTTAAGPAAQPAH